MAVSEKEKKATRCVLPFVVAGYVVCLVAFHLAIVASGAFSYKESKVLFIESFDDLIDDVKDTWAGITPLFTRRK